MLLVLLMLLALLLTRDSLVGSYRAGVLGLSRALSAQNTFLVRRALRCIHRGVDQKVGTN